MSESSLERVEVDFREPSRPVEAGMKFWEDWDNGVWSNGEYRSPFPILRQLLKDQLPANADDATVQAIVHGTRLITVRESFGIEQTAPNVAALSEMVSLLEQAPNATADMIDVSERGAWADTDLLHFAQLILDKGGK